MTRLLGASMMVIGESVPLSLIVKATVVTVLAMAAAWMAARRPASVRHLIFVAAFAVLGLLPAATAVVPAIPVLSLPAARATEPSAVHSFPVVGVRPVPVSSAALVAPMRALPPVAAVTLVQIVWLAGMICSLLPAATGLWQIRRIRRQGVPWHDAGIVAMDLAQRAGIHRPVDVVLHPGIFTPMTCGVLKPAIVFPVDARSWSDVDVRRALTHELEHVCRHDWLTLCLGRVVCAAYWFHPLVWLAHRQLRLNAERACDDAVLRESLDVGYADQLVTLAQRSSAQAHRPLLAMANPSELSTRVRAVLDEEQRRGRASTWERTIVATAAATTVALVAPMWTIAAPLEQTQTGGRSRTAADSARFDAASIKPSFSNGIVNVRPFPDRLTADATLQVLMQYAYGVQPFQVLGGPRWLTSARYEIDARAEAAVSRDRLFAMLQSLLEERFQLKTHREMRDLPAFILVANQKGPTLSPPRDGVCAEAAADAAVEWAGGRMAFPGELEPAKVRCGSATVGLDPRGAHITGGRIAMAEFVRLLSLLVGRNVIDRSGVTDRFDVQLDFVPDETTPAMPPPPPQSPISGVSIAQALQQQLGLRLESTRSPVDLIVIDQAEPPSPN